MRQIQLPKKPSKKGIHTTLDLRTPSGRLLLF
jgi:hypothetical protein